MDVLVVTPFERPDASLVRTLASLCDDGAVPFLDLGRRRREGRAAMRALRGVGYGVRIPEGTAWSVDDLDEGVHTVIVGAGTPVDRWGARRVFVAVRTVEEAEAAAEAGAAGVIGHGAEAGGRVGPDNAFVLCQRLDAAGLPIPFWIQGGIGPHTAAACVAGGARGVVIDAQVALATDSAVPLALQRVLRKADGSETILAAGHRLLARPGWRSAEAPPADEATLFAGLADADPLTGFITAGQDLALAAPLAARFGSVAGIVAGIRRGAAEALEAGATTRPLASAEEGGAWAVAHGTAHPIAQGPMTRVSDVASFAAAVAEGGGLPFIALSLLRGDKAATLLQETADACGDRPWGAGILGFAPPEVRGPQLEAIAAVRPPFALIAGGRPSQARELEEAGTPTYLHCPSPALLRAFLADGARRFVFEGNECGGHVGPRSSLVLWEQVTEVLAEHEDVSDVQVLFAGGIHDARSAGMVSAMAGPLAARGAHVGVLMGTAYLFTEEAVATGAIQPGFQAAALAAERTALVQTAPGHATRCVDSPFVEAFEAERARLEAAGTDPKAMWEALEQLNLGRLRIASKGIVREGGALVAVDEATQQAEGMFMIGQVAALRGEVTTIDALHTEISDGSVARLAPWLPEEEAEERSGPVDIAIVGMAALFPDAPDVDTYWSHILAGHDAVREVPETRFRLDAYYDPDGVPGETTPSKWGGFLPPVRFEPMRYGIPPRSLVSIDPSQLLALDVARRALEDAGLGDDPELRARTSVIFGTESGSDLGSLYTMRAHLPQLVGEVPDALDAVLPRLTEDSFPGVLANVLAGRIANRLDLGGVNYTVDAACASSLAAVDLAVKELLDGVSDVVVCGGADLHNGVHDYLLFSSTHALSATGRCRTFDASADGIVLGEGVAAVVLRRLEDARRDGQRVYAVLKGLGGSSDGRSLGLTAPRKEGQRRAVDRAWQRAGVDPAELGLVEAHGTGTVVGDRTEMRTLEEEFAGRASGVLLGSVKSQIGHTKCAAGLAGLIKVALAAHHGVRPGMAPIREPNTGWDAEHSPFHFSSVARPWVGPRRVAAVSAFGFGGTNFHAVLEADTAMPTPPRARPAELFLFRGEDAAIDRRLDLLAARLDDAVPPSLAGLAKAVGEEGSGPVRIAVVAADHPSLRAALSAARDRTPVGGTVWIRPETVSQGKLAYLFPGQGSQRPHMLADLFVAMPALQSFLASAPDLVDVIFPADAYDDAGRKAHKAAITDTRVAQPALGMVDLAAAAFLDGLGVQADMAAGHSYGELAALAWAGAIDPDDLVPLSRARAEAILGAAPADDAGGMAAVRSTPDTLRAVLADHPDVVVANHNAPNQTVIAGPKPALAAAVAALGDQRIAARTIPVACAFHSPVVAAASSTFAEALGALTMHAPDVPVWSNTTAEVHPSDPDGIRALLARQVAEPVRFVDEITAMLDAGVRVFVEVGPGEVLAKLVRAIAKGRDDVTVVSLERGGDGSWASLLGALAVLTTQTDVALDVAPLFAGRDLAPVDLSRGPAASGPVWQVDGHRAWPVDGALPPGGLVPVVEPIRLTAAASVPTGAADHAILSFLDNMRAMADAQRDVMLQALGAAPGRSVGPVMEARLDPPGAPASEVRPRIEARPPRAAAAPAPAKAARPLLDVLRGVVADRTGYPEEMLGPDLDLEADLSIDSIKRIEILNGLGDALGGSASLDDSALEQLAGERTLQGLVDRLTALGVSSPEGDSQAASSGGAAMDLMGTLVGVVADRTGYPEEMLGPDLDLEADLSIDSIKRIEILNGLGEALGSSASLDDSALEQLASERTLRGIVDALGSHLGTAPAASPATVASAAPEAASSDDIVRRYVLVESEVAGDDAAPADSAGPTRIALVDRDAARAEAIVAGLSARGVAIAHTAPDAVGEAEAVVQVDGAGAIATFPDLRDVLEGGARRVLGFDAGGAGLDGLFKTAAREYPDRSVRLVTLDDVADTGALLDAVQSELGRPTDPVHVTRASGRRATRVLTHTPLDRVDGRLPLTTDSVVLLTGGARGITARIAIAMAHEAPCTYVLVGRSPWPAPETDAELLAAKDDKALRSILIRRGGTPAAIESQVGRILRDREMRETEASIVEAGGRVAYHALDVRDGAAVEALVTALYAEHGRIDGVVHGAGVLDDRLMRDKTAEAFARVYETKVHPAQAFARTLRDDVAFVVFFGSISGVLGNRGQADYASANATLDAIAHALGSRIEGRAVSIDWGPWGGAGMVSDALERAYRRRGIGLIPVEAGVQAFLDELRAGDRGVHQVVWQAGDVMSFGADADG